MTIATQTTGRQWTVASETKPNTLYIVKLVNGQFSCDCPGNFYRGSCKHAKAVAAAQPYAFKVDPSAGLAAIMAPRTMTA